MNGLSGSRLQPRHQNPKKNRALAPDHCEANSNIIAAILVLCVVIAALPACAQEATTPPILRDVSIAQNLNARISPDLTFRDEAGKTVRLGDYFGQKPILLSLVYFDCPALCTEVLNGELRTMRSISLNLGKDFDAVTVSFEPKDTPALAKAKRDVYAGQYGRPGAQDHWHFLTGEQQSIDALTQAVGFHYAYDSAGRQYAHAAAIMVLTPDGRIARYFYGVQFPARDVRLGLVEASDGRIGTPTDHALLYCYQYDPMTGKYGFVVMNLVRAAGGVTVLALAIFMFVMFRRDRKLAGVPRAGL
jgi:protein SCO1